MVLIMLVSYTCVCPGDLISANNAAMFMEIRTLVMDIKDGSPVVNGSQVKDPSLSQG